MPEVVVAQRMWQRRGDAALWLTRNPVLEAGEIGVELSPIASVPHKFKIGDGVTAWAGLPYQGGGGGASDAEDVSFDNAGTLLLSTDVQGALAELDERTQGSATSGYVGSVPLLVPGTAVVVGPGKALWVAPDSGFFRNVLVGVSQVASSGATSVDVKHAQTGTSIFSQLPAVPAGGFSSETGTPAVIDFVRGSFSRGEVFVVDVATAGTGASGLALALDYALTGEVDPNAVLVSSLLHFDDSFADETGTVFSMFGSPAIGPGKFGGGMLLTAGDSGLLAPPNLEKFALGAGSFAVELFLKPDMTQPSSASALVSMFDVGGLNGWQLLMSSAGVPRWYQYSGGGSYPLTATGVDLRGGWHHLAVTRSAGVLRMFVDGVLTGSVANTVDYNNGSQPLSIGYQHLGGARYPFRGGIDEVRITKGAPRYESTFSPPTRPFPYRGRS